MTRDTKLPTRRISINLARPTFIVHAFGDMPEEFYREAAISFLVDDIRRKLDDL